VVDARDEPVEAWVEYWGTDASGHVSEPQMTLTDTDGVFAYAVASDALQTIHATAASGEARLERVRPSQGIVLRVLDYGSLSATVTSDRGASPATFTLHYRPVGSFAFIEERGFGGRFSLPWLAPGNYELRVTSELGSLSTSTSLAPGQRAVLSLVLSSVQARLASE
jgi:hypothetical protein